MTSPTESTPVDAEPELDRAAGTKAVKEILEHSPLLTPTILRFPLSQEVTGLDEIEPDRVRELCLHVNCKGPEKMTFVANARGRTLWVYTCSNCGTYKRTYWPHLRPIKVENMRKPPGVSTQFIRECAVLKLGQDPAWQPGVPKGIWRPLGGSEDFLSRGIACLREGYGIGAAAYFRRVIEDETNAILDQLESAATSEENEPALEQLRAARQERAAKDRLKLASERIPKMLKRGGANPVHTLYDALSGPLHEDSEDKSLKVAQKTLKALTLILGVLRDHLAELTEASKDLAELRDDG